MTKKTARDLLNEVMGPATPDAAKFVRAAFGDIELHDDPDGNYRNVFKADDIPKDRSKHASYHDDMDKKVYRLHNKGDDEVDIEEYDDDDEYNKMQIKLYRKEENEPEPDPFDTAARQNLKDHQYDLRMRQTRLLRSLIADASRTISGHRDDGVAEGVIVTGYGRLPSTRHARVMPQKNGTVQTHHVEVHARGKLKGKLVTHDSLEAAHKYLRVMGLKAVKEEVEPIDELSKKTLGSYIKKASDKMREADTRSSYYAARSGGDAAYNKERAGYWAKIGNNREHGIKRATDRLTKEEVEVSEGRFQISWKSNSKFQGKPLSSHTFVVKAKDTDEAIKKAQSHIEKTDPSDNAHKVAPHNVFRVSEDWSAPENTILTEISKATLASYINKAATDYQVKDAISKGHDSRLKGKFLSKSYRDMLAQRQDDNERAKLKRARGIERAGRKLANEDLSLTELSKATLGSYVKKATDSVTRTSGGMWRTGERKKPAHVGRSMKYINKAVDRLTKESVELDENVHNKIRSLARDGYVESDKSAGDRTGHVVDKGTGVHTFRKSFYYPKGTSEDYANRVSKNLDQHGIKHTVVGHGRQDAPFRGGASASQSSHFWVKVKPHVPVSEGALDELSDVTKASYLSKALKDKADAEKGAKKSKKLTDKVARRNYGIKLALKSLHK